MERALKELTPDQVIDEMKKSNMRGRGGAVPDGNEVELRAEGISQAKVHPLQRG